MTTDKLLAEFFAGFPGLSTRGYPKKAFVTHATPPAAYLPSPNRRVRRRFRSGLDLTAPKEAGLKGFNFRGHWTSLNTTGFAAQPSPRIFQIPRKVRAISRD